jgi:hypothetical protein
MKSVLRISDDTRSYPFVYEDSKVYWPNCNPCAFGDNIQYKFVGGDNEVIFDGRACLACAEFRYEGYNYCQYVEVFEVGVGERIELIPWANAELIDNQLVGGDVNTDYSSVQSAHYNPGSFELHLDTQFITATLKLNGEYISGPAIFCRLNYPSTEISKQYGGGKVNIRYELALMDDDDLYWCINLEDDRTEFESFPITSMMQWKDDMRFVAIAHILIEHGDGALHIDVRGDSVPFTQEMCGYIIQSKTSIYNIEKSIIDNMIVNKPRILNKTIQKVVEMTAQTDSKSNIVQPVFYRTRELASIIIHPAVTENICINLDAYKSSVDRFYIKIEGTSYSEVGRTESGVIFKVQGSLLPGTVTSGTYYILNEDADLVTTGKYKYES